MRVKMIVAYDGTNYKGWQVQPNGITIEEVLNKNLSNLLGEQIVVSGASRTDSGVHSLGNIAVFDTNTRMPADKIAFALNQRLPEDIVVQGSCEVEDGWHPRYQNSRKTYEYRILNRTFRMPTRRLDTYFYHYPLDVEKMKKAAMRCGFLLSSPAVIGMLRKVIAPYPIPVPSADIAAQALSPESVSLMHRRAAQCVMRKCELEVALEDLDGVEAVYPSASNFLLVRFVDAARVFTALRDRGIILRDQSRQPTLENCIRITVGTKDENERLLTELEEILKEAA